MKVLKTSFRFSNTFAALMLLLQLQCFAFVRGETQIFIDHTLVPDSENNLELLNENQESMALEPENVQALVENVQFDFSEIEQSINATIISNDEISDNRSEELPDEEFSPPISGSTVPFFVPVETTINLQLVNTPTLMDQDQLNAFHAITFETLSFHLFQGTFLPLIIESERIEVEILQQTRSTMVQLAAPGQALQPRFDGIPEPLYVGLRISAKIYEEDIEDADLRFHKVLGDIFTEKEDEYVNSLKLMDSYYFAMLDEANIITEITADIIPYDEAFGVKEASIQNEDEQEEEEEEEEQEEEQAQEQEQKPLDISSKDPESISSIQETKDVGRDDEIQGGALPLGPIIGIAISGVILLILVGFLIARKYGGKKKSNDSEPILSSPRKKKLWSDYDGLEDHAESVANENLLSNGLTSSDQKSYVGSNDDLESQAMYSYNPSGITSVGTNGGNVNIHPNPSYNFDNMSYAFSLEPGIEASTIGGMSTRSDRSDYFRNQRTGSDLPIQEIPQVRMSTNEKLVHDDRKKTNSQKNEEYVMYDHFGNTEIEREPSDLKLTESELQMLPSNLRGSSVESEFKTVTREVTVPPGKLGIVIDTSIEGPVIHSVKKDSYLYGKIFSGDVIVAVDNVDTRAMTAAAITTMMAKNARKHRNLTVQRAA